jgi:hypothetical protein
MNVADPGGIAGFFNILQPSTKFGATTHVPAIRSPGVQKPFEAATFADVRRVVDGLNIPDAEPARRPRGFIVDTLA